MPSVSTPCASEAGALPGLDALREQARMLTGAQFGHIQTHNNHGLLGELSARTPCGQFELSASLSCNEPDVSDADRRSSHTLSICIQDEAGREVYALSDMPYDCPSDSPGEHLRELLLTDQGGLLHLLFDQVFAVG